MFTQARTDRITLYSLYFCMHMYIPYVLYFAAIRRNKDVCIYVKTHNLRRRNNKIDVTPSVFNKGRKADRNDNVIISNKTWGRSYKDIGSKPHCS